MNRLYEDTFEMFLSRVLTLDRIDMRDITFIDPYGMVGILEWGRFFSKEGERKELVLPESEVVIKYLERMDFFKYAGRYFSFDSRRTDRAEKYLRRSHSDVLLEITPIEKSDDIHYIVGRVRKRAHSILARHLHYNKQAVGGFIVALSEVCQNIIEHSEHTGFVGIQKYYFKKQDRNVVKIAVTDLGIGFRASLSERADISSDIEAIEKALVHGYSRHREEGRGHGLAAVRRFVSQWNGKISIRSGTARFSIIPDWAWGKNREKGLVRFPGSQISMMLPEV